MKIVKDDFLSGVLVYEAYQISDVSDFSSSSELLREYFEKTRKSFYYIKVPTSALEKIQVLSRLGFCVVDVNVTFERSVSAQTDFQGNCCLRQAESGDEEDTVCVARENFIYTRFHLDEAFSNETANRVKASWVRNFFHGKRGEQMILASSQGRVGGFLQLLRREKILIIDQIAVDKRFQRKGFAGDMIRFAEKENPSYEKIRVGTQIVNTPSIRLYEGLGFRLCSSQYVLHLHHQREEKK